MPVRDLKGNDLLIVSYGTDLYSITFQETTSPNPICLVAKASSSQAWLWHRHLSRLNFDTINLLSKNDIVTGFPQLKFVNDHLCYSCELGKAKRKWCDLDKMKEKGDACIFMGHSTYSKAPDYVSSEPAPQCLTTALEHDSLSPSPQSKDNVPLADETVTTLLNDNAQIEYVLGSLENMEDDKKIGRKHEENDFQTFPDNRSLDKRSCFGSRSVVNAILSQLSVSKWICDMTNPKANELYLNGMEDILDDGDSMEARKLTVEKSKEEIELFEALNHKSVIVNEGSHRVVVFKKAPPRAYTRQFIRFSFPCNVDGQDYGKYGRKMVRDVRVEIHGFTFLVDFVVIGYANEGEPSVLFGRDFLVTSKSRVDFGIGEMRIDLTMLEEMKEIDAMLDALVENLEEVGSSNGDLLKIGKASSNKNHKVNILTVSPNE
ncbi:hypothetical protein Tco_1228126 [Tanacetum coccineum]